MCLQQKWSQIMLKKLVLMLAVVALVASAGTVPSRALSRYRRPGAGSPQHPRSEYLVGLHTGRTNRRVNDDNEHSGIGDNYYLRCISDAVHLSARRWYPPVCSRQLSTRTRRRQARERSAQLGCEDSSRRLTDPHPARLWAPQLPIRLDAQRLSQRGCRRRVPRAREPR